jgi:hypothetical protein
MYIVTITRIRSSPAPPQASTSSCLAQPLPPLFSRPQPAAQRHTHVTSCGGQVISTTHHVSGSGSGSGSLSTANLLSLFLQQSIRIRALLAQRSDGLFHRLQVAYGLVVHAAFSCNRHEQLIQLGLKLGLRRVLQF